MFKWQVNSPEVQAAAIMAAMEQLRQFDPRKDGTMHQADLTHWKSDWFAVVRRRAEDMLRELDPNVFDS